jgi:large subunit ribosomal protein L3
MFGLLGEKIGMTQVYDADGAFIPVTVVRVLPNVITAIMTKDKNGYNAVQLGYGDQKESRLNKPQAAALKKAGIKPVRLLKEFRTEKSADFKVGTMITAKSFSVGETVDIQGRSKGRGFQGVMKRWHFAGGRDSHGCSLSHRVPGSVGQRAYPGRVFPGKKMPGQMGDKTSTMENLTIVGVEAEQNLILIKGALPGGSHASLSIMPHAADFEKRVLAADSSAAS